VIPWAAHSSWPASGSVSGASLYVRTDRRVSRAASTEIWLCIRGEGREMVDPSADTDSCTGGGITVFPVHPDKRSIERMNRRPAIDMGFIAFSHGAYQKGHNYLLSYWGRCGGDRGATGKKSGNA